MAELFNFLSNIFQLLHMCSNKDAKPNCVFWNVILPTVLIAAIVGIGVLVALTYDIFCCKKPAIKPAEANRKDKITNKEKPNIDLSNILNDDKEQRSQLLPQFSSEPERELKKTSGQTEVHTTLNL